MPANYVLLQRIELNASAASVTFSNIPQSGYTDLKIVLSARTTYADQYDGLTFTFNGSTANFSTRQLYGTGSTAASNSSSSNGGPLINANTSTSNTFGNAEVYIPNYLGNQAKSVSSDGMTENNATQAFGGCIATLWNNTAAINSITLGSANSSNFLANSTFSLYGLAAVGTTPVIAPKASGGNITTDGTYWYHTFLATDTFTPQTSLSADILVVAGGGGGGGRGASNGTPGGGGAGAGGLLAFTSQALTATSYTCTVGAGGAGGISNSSAATNGVDSQFGALTLVKGGGRGSTYGLNSNNGGNGGSGGGTSNNGTAGTATSGQGNNGGTATSDGASGGGGAGAAGGNTTNTNGGAGGNGVNTYSSWATATNTGANSGYYAGGGGGAPYQSPQGTVGAGGLGGGGSATNGGTGVAGTVNTGGGGGGAGDSSTTARTGGAGGSGIVIIRYAMA